MVTALSLQGTKTQRFEILTLEIADLGLVRFGLQHCLARLASAEYWGMSERSDSVPAISESTICYGRDPPQANDCSLKLHYIVVHVEGRC